MTGREEWEEFRGWFEDAWRWVEIRDTEIRAAQARHPDQADRLFHAWDLVARPYWMESEAVYRGYVRELLDRVAAGEDTRPATAAEVALGCARYMMAVKPAQVVTGLAHRMWLAAFPDYPVYDDLAKQVSWYEWDVGRGKMDDLEDVLRRILRQPQRRMPETITCDRNHGPCRFAREAEGDAA